MIKISLEKYVELFLSKKYDDSVSFIDNILIAEKEYFEVQSKDTSISHRFAIHCLEQKYSSLYNIIETVEISKKHSDEILKQLRSIWDSHDFLCKLEKLEKSKDINIQLNNIGDRP